MIALLFSPCPVIMTSCVGVSVVGSVLEGGSVIGCVVVGGSVVEGGSVVGFVGVGGSVVACKKKANTIIVVPEVIDGA